MNLQGVMTHKTIRKGIWNSYTIPVIAVIICLITRLLFFGKYIDEWDSVNFAFGLSKEYDILHDQPHFPGYPVYMFVSWICYQIFGSDIKSLIFSGILFSSLGVYPLYVLARRMFSEKVALLAAALYIANPQIWLQAEKALSDAFGLFFVISSVLFFYLTASFDSQNEEKIVPEVKNFRTPLWYFACGGILLGLGLGVRVTYLALIPVMVYAGYQLTREINWKKVTAWGLSGLTFGIFSWLTYLLVYFTPQKCLWKLLNHADYHFNREGNSIITTSDYGERFYVICYRLIAHCMGMWWPDASHLRIVPTVICGFALVYFFKRLRWNIQSKFMSIFFVSYFLWVAFVQNAIRQVMVLAPFIIIVISVGLLSFYTFYLKEKRYGVVCVICLTAVIITAQMVDSVRIVSINRNVEPPSVSRIHYITSNFNKEDTKFYCLNDWRLFQYYAPEWHDRRNRHVYFVSHMDGVKRDVKRLFRKPKNLLISSKLFGRHKYKKRLKMLAVFKRDKYSVADYNWLALYRLEPLVSKNGKIVRN